VNPAATAALAEAVDSGATVTIVSPYGVATGQAFDHPTEPEAILVKGFTPSTPLKFHRDDVEEVIFE
jgi:hypothetical protein